MFKKNKKQTETIKEPKEKKVRTVKVGTHKKTVIALWVVLIASVSFGVYKNFTAIDQHTTHEKEIIELRLQDTNGIENFVILFFPVFTIITIITLLMEFQYTENEMQANALYSISFGMVVMNVFVYYLINDIVIRDAKLHEKEMLELQVKNQIQMYRSVSENFDIQKRKSHEFKNQILCIEALLKDKKYDRAVDYVSKISKGFFKERNAINTNQVVVNAILNTKYEEAINKHIVFVFKVNDLSNIKMEDEDLVVILANLLNNAIEACENCIGKKVIKFKFMMEEQMIILSVKNTCNQMIIYHNNEIATTKMINQDEHGVGIKNIIRIVEKYNGEYVIQNDEDQFYFSIIIPL